MPHKNWALEEREKRLDALENLFKSVLPRSYSYMKAYIQRQWHIGPKTAKEDIELFVDLGIIVNDKGTLKLEDVLSVTVSDKKDEKND